MKSLVTLAKEAFTTEFVADAAEDKAERLLTTLVKEAFTNVLVEAMDVFNWDKLLATLAKEAFTLVFVADAAEDNADKLLATLVKEAFTSVLLALIAVSTYAVVDTFVELLLGICVIALQFVVKSAVIFFKVVKGASISKVLLEYIPSPYL